MNVNTEIVEKQGGIPLNTGLFDYRFDFPSERPKKVIQKLNPDCVFKWSIKLFAGESGRSIRGLTLSHFGNAFSRSNIGTITSSASAPMPSA